MKTQVFINHNNFTYILNTSQVGDTAILFIPTSIHCTPHSRINITYQDSHWSRWYQVILNFFTLHLLRTAQNRTHYTESMTHIRTVTLKQLDTNTVTCKNIKQIPLLEYSTKGILQLL